MGFHLSLSARNARAAALVSQIDKASSAGTLKIFTTTQPAPGGAPSGTPIAIVPLQKPCGTVANGQITFAITQPAQISASGTAVWARAEDGDGNWVADGDIAVTGTPDAAFTIGSTALFAGAFIFLFNATLTEPA